MHVKFNIAQKGDHSDTAFKMLRVSMFKLYFSRWAHEYNIHDYQFIAHEGNVKIMFKHSSELSMFALVWTNYNNYEYTIVKA
jgi:hypothetical protein